jgi:F0F1-type ATP synthase membrane subunit b/b'
MAERKQKIIDSVTDSEKRLADARERLDEATTQFILSKSTTDKITQELQLTKTKIIKSGAERITNEVVTQMKAAELTIFLQEQKLLAEIKKQIITLALKRVILKLQRDLSPTQYGIIIEKSIDRIGEFKTLTSSGGTR